MPASAQVGPFGDAALVFLYRRVGWRVRFVLGVEGVGKNGGEGGGIGRDGGTEDEIFSAEIHVGVWRRHVCDEKRSAGELLSVLTEVVRWRVIHTLESMVKGNDSWDGGNWDKC